MKRGTLLDAWRRKRSGGGLLSGGAAGGDFLVLSNEDRLGLRGAAGLLPLGDANGLTLVAARERVPLAGATPVVAGVCATDPLRLMDKFLPELQALGVSGIQNRPSVGMIDGTFRTSVEEAKLGYGLEVDLIREARALDLLTLAQAFNPDEARRMVDAGADGIVVHPGAEPRAWGAWAEAIAAAARQGRPDVLIFSWGRSIDGVDGTQTDGSGV